MTGTAAAQVPTGAGAAPSAHRGGGHGYVATEACVGGTSKLPAPTVTSAVLDTRWTDTFRRFGDSGGGWPDHGGWAASDGTYSTTLPGGRVAWMFNDTFLGPVNRDESLPRDAGFVHNSIALAGRDGVPRVTVTGGTRRSPESLVGATVTAPPWDPSGTNSRWYWNGDGIVDGGKLRILEYAQKPTDAAPPWNFQWTDTMIATFSLPGLKLESVTPTYDQSNISWGVELFRCGGWTYIYGMESGNMHVARARAGHLTDNLWQFWTGSGWSTDPTASAPVIDNVGSSYAVTPVGGSFVLTTSDHYLGDKIYTATAPAPTGPFTHRKEIFTAPEAGGNIYAPYNIAAHPEISAPGHLVISYNVNSQKIDDLYANANNNRPRFVDLTLGRS
ncbi:DUF5005 domain-containing protein [Nakamurella endophytica]|uniref:DUF5005 domain-containing protein n=1 Tax=Nakamurella endophytica TaxID=1748367 RepID=UPI00166A4938|nr:DUF5005 domain-containing protein [Nakamurella endophytica]